MSSNDRTATVSSLTRRLDRVLPEQAVAGIVLVVIGIVIVASRLVSGVGDYALLAVGITCLIAFVLTREYGYAIAAGITGGLGVGVILSGIATDPYDGVVFLGSFSGGFAAVWILGLFALPRETNPWPLIPAALVGAVALTVLTESSTVLDAVVVSIAIVLVLAGLGALRGGRKAAS